MSNREKERERGSDRERLICHCGSTFDMKNNILLFAGVECDCVPEL